MAPTTEDNANAKEDMAVPYELLELIVEEYWASPLSRKERIAFMTMSQLISTQWACAFDSISLRDVYIPCVPYLYHYRSVLSRKAPTPKPHESLPARNACRTLTFQRPHLDTGATSLYQSVSKKAVAHLMDTLYAIPRLPNLRHLYLEYFFVTLDGESQKCQAFPFPLIPLDVKYSFEPSVPSGLIRAMGATGDPLSSPWSPPTIRTVSVWESVHKDAAVDVMLLLTFYSPALDWSSLGYQVFTRRSCLHMVAQITNSSSIYPSPNFPCSTLKKIEETRHVS